MTNEEIVSRFKKKHGDRYDYSLVNYKNKAHEPLKIVCKDHGVFPQSYANHNSGQGCPVCAKEFSPRLRSGFIKSGEYKNYASLYLINCFNHEENFYKIGITTKELKRRFGGQSQLPYEYEIKYLFVGDPGVIWDLEKILHRQYKANKYIPNIEFGGMYECFTSIDHEEFKSRVESLT